MTDALDEVLAAVGERVEPDDEERARMDATVAELLDRVRGAIEDLPVDAEPMLVGSVARNTWISGDRDVDVFVRFPAEFPGEELERHGLAVGHAVLPDSHEEYAEHPYVRGTADGFDVDLVPCYAVESARSIASSVDRTPFHTEYLAERLTDELANETRIFKAFLKGIGAYGSNLRTRGFSGYLTELLVLEYGSARATIEAAADWHPPIRLDPEGHGGGSFDDPLVVIDPTDPDRNVAAVVSAENVARLQHHARDLIADPRADVFVPPETAALSAEAVREHVRRRETTPVVIVFETPNLVDDELYPQLRKSLAGVGDELDRRGFDVFRRATFAEGRAVLLFELAVPERPAVERHEGPPIHVREHAEDFYERYEGADVYGPFIDGDRYVVERDREFASATTLLQSSNLLETRLGPAIEGALRSDYEVLEGEEIGALADEFGAELADYFEPSP